MAGDLGERLTPIEVVLELRGRLLLFKGNFRFHHRLAPEQSAQLGAGLGIVADALGQDVTSPRQGAGDIGDALFSADVSPRLGIWIGGGLLAEEDVRKRFQPSLFGDGRPGAAFGPVRLINIFERGEGLGFGDGILERIGEEIAFGEGFQDRVPALIQLREAQEPLANAGDGHFVQRSGGFLPIPGDEGDRGALGEKFGGGGDLPGLHFELTRYLKNMCFVHFKTDRLLYPSAVMP